jgi:hypothetical protein
MMLDWGTTERELLADDEREACALVRREIGLDVLRQPQFWEHVVARYLGGRVTSHGALWDVDVTIWGSPCHAEVKFASAFFASYNPIRGKDWSRDVFRWALPRGNSGKIGADACILIGLDTDRIAYRWVVPITAIKQDCRAITIATPRARTIATMPHIAVKAYAIAPRSNSCHSQPPPCREGRRQRERKA